MPLTIATGPLVSGAVERAPSFTVTLTVIWSPRLPLPAVARLSVDAVAPARSTPFRAHW